MKASELTMGQRFRFVDHPTEYIRVWQHGGKYPVSYLNEKGWQVSSCAGDLEVVAVEPTPHAFNVGDWVVPLDYETPNFSKWFTKGVAAQVLRIEGDWLSCFDGDACGWSVCYFRHARPDEIPQPATALIGPLATVVSYGKPPVEPIPFHETPCCDVVPCDNNYVTDERGFVREPDGVVTCADHRDKPDSEGWIEWHRNRCPTDANQLVQVVWREDGTESKQYLAKDIDWSAITHYRLVTPAPKQYRPFASAETHEILQMINNEMLASDNARLRELLREVVATAINDDYYSIGPDLVLRIREVVK